MEAMLDGIRSRRMTMEQLVLFIMRLFDGDLTRMHLVCLKCPLTKGWSSLQHSIYFRANFTVEQDGIFLVSVTNVHSFKIDDRSFVGNIYGYTRASDNAIYLKGGIHTIYVCTVLDVSVFGGFVS